MYRFSFLAAAAVFLCGATGGGPAIGDNHTVRYLPSPAWITPPPVPSDSQTPAESPLRIAYFDQQVHIDATGYDIYTAYRARILKPDGLTVGNLTLGWNPAAGSATVHRVRIIRDGVASDVLAANPFQTIQRESGLEAARITGAMTAALQVPGLRVGDELEVAHTIRVADPTLGEHVFLGGSMPLVGSLGTYRTMVGWDARRAVQWRLTPDLGAATPVAGKDGMLLTLEMRDPAPVVATDGAPARYNLRRTYQFSDFGSWKEVSIRLAPLFESAAALSATSPLQAEVRRIAALSKEPTERARLALKLVQDDVRYVYVGLNGGNYRPMTADSTWDQRMGDCKAKTVLLLALLHGLGIDAEPVLVPSNGRDIAAMLLPSPIAFDHVLVRAVLGGQALWLDGTRPDGGRLEPSQPIAFRYALPLRRSGAELEQLPAQTARLPMMIETIDVDLTHTKVTDNSSGDDAPVIAREFLRGDTALQMKAQLSALSVKDAENGLRDYWTAEESWITSNKTEWVFDPVTAVLKLTVTGTAKNFVTRGADKNVSFDVPASSLFEPPEYKRPAAQDQKAPWLTAFPDYRCYVSNVRLPPGKHRWETLDKVLPAKLGGVRYRREAEVRDGVVRTIMAIRAERAEIDADMATATNTARASFDTNRIKVFERATVPGFHYQSTELAKPLPLVGMIDWAAEETACAF